MSQNDFVTRGQSLVAAGQFQEAVKVCRLGLLGRPTTVEGRVVLGQALLALKRYDEVLAEMRVALELDHTSIPANLLKGEAQIRKGDGPGAMETLKLTRQMAPSDPRAQSLYAEAERLAGRPMFGTNGFVGGETVNYPNHEKHEILDDEGPGNYTRPTSLSAPTAKKRSNRQQAFSPEQTPPPNVLAVGDRSGTMEVDPAAEGLDLDDDELGALAHPPSSPAPMVVGSPRAKRPSQAEIIAARRPRSRKEVSAVSSVELDADDLVEVGSHDEDDDDSSETRSAAKAYSGTAVRNAVGMPSGPLSQSMPAQQPPYPGMAGRPTAMGQAQPQPLFPPPPQQLAQHLAGHPHAMTQLGMPGGPQGMPPQHMQPPMQGMPPPQHMMPPPPQHMMPPPPQHMMPPPPQHMMPPPPQHMMPPPQQHAGRPIAAAMPTMAAMPPPPMIPAGPASATFRAAAPPPPMHNPMSPLQQESAALVDQMFSAEPAPAWAHKTVAAQPGPGYPHQMSHQAAMEPTMRPMPPINPSDPNISGYPVDSPLPVGMPSQPDINNQSQAGKHKTGQRKRSKAWVVVWITIGALVIGGGVFAGFKIRAMRLDKQIDEARDQATDQAKSDTWQGWLGARENLARIMTASATIDHKAALARVRGLMAYEFGDGLTEAKTAVEALGGDGGADAQIAEAYVALANNDAKAAKAAADLAIGNAPNDPGAHYVLGRAKLLAGDPKDAVGNLKEAADAEARPLYLIGLAQGLAAVGSVDEAIAALDKALKDSQDNPAAAIARAFLLSHAGRLNAANLANDTHAQLDRLATEGAKPVTDQMHGVAPAQIAFAELALAQVDHARGKMQEAIADVNKAAAVEFDDPRFAEAAVDTLYRIGRPDLAKTAGDKAAKQFPASRNVKVSLARALIAQGKPNDALDVFAKTKDLVQDPEAQVVRAQALAATGDVAGARGDYASALKKAPNLESAIVGTAWLDVAGGQLDDAKKAIDKRYGDGKTASTALATIEAAILRTSGDTTKARAILEKVVAGAPSVDMPRAQLEMARTYRDAGELRLARQAYGEAAKSNLVEARLETGILAIEDRDPNGGRESIDALLKELGDKAPPQVVIEGARARMLVGDHAGAKQLLEIAEKQTGTVKWQLAREKGRLALRKGDYAGAAQELGRALDSCDDDAETFILAAETVDGDSHQAALADKIKALAPKRLGSKAEAHVVAGLLALSDVGDGTDAAQQAYDKAKEQLAAEKASGRRQARVHFGLAVVEISRKDLVNAQNEIDATMITDPSLYNAYLYAAQLVAEKKPPQALEMANKAVTYNPDSLDGWAEVGTLAAKLNNTKRLGEAIARLGEIGPTTEQFKAVNALKKR